MHLFLKLICVLLSAVMLLCCAGCKVDVTVHTDTSSDNTSSFEETSSEDNTSSDNSSSNISDTSSYYDVGTAKPYDPSTDYDSIYGQDSHPGFVPSVKDEFDNEHDSAANASSSLSSSKPASSVNSSSSSKPSSSASSSSSKKPSSSNQSSSKPNNSNSNTGTNIVQTKNGYTYVWGDEFEGASLNKKIWSDQSTKMTGGNVLSLESSPKTISVNNGALTLRAYKDKSGVYHVPPSVHTQGTMNYQYGYMEMRAKLSLEVGSFASFWTRSISDNPKAAVGPSMQLDHFFEVDMFEVFQRNGKQSIGGNILINSSIKSKNWYPTAMPHTQQLVIPDEEYHLFGYEWTPTEIKLYFDDKMYARFDMSAPWTGERTNGKGIDGWNQELRPDNTGTNLVSFQECQYLILNHHLHIAVDDGNGGVKGFLASKSVTENKNFKEALYTIDYIRLYQKQGQKLYVK